MAQTQFIDYQPCVPNTYISRHEFLTLKTCHLSLSFSLRSIILSIAHTYNKQLLNLMVERGYDFHNEGDSSGLLFSLVGVNTPEATDFLTYSLDLGAPLETVDKEGRTPLLEAVWFDDLGAVKVLLEHGANMYAVGKQQQNIFDMASGGGDTVQLFSLFVSQPNFDIFQFVGGKTDRPAHSFFTALKRCVYKKKFEAIDVIFNSFSNSQEAQKFQDALLCYCEYLQTDNNNYYMNSHVDTELYSVIDKLTQFTQILKEKEMLQTQLSLLATPVTSGVASIAGYESALQKNNYPSNYTLEDKGNQKSLLIKI